MVGCAPCINSGKDDISRWADRFPEMIDKIRTMEATTGNTFFSPCVPGILPRMSTRGKRWKFSTLDLDEVVRVGEDNIAGEGSSNIFFAIWTFRHYESKFGLCRNDLPAIVIPGLRNPRPRQRREPCGRRAGLRKVAPVAGFQKIWGMPEALALRCAPGHAKTGNRRKLFTVLKSSFRLSLSA